MGEFTTFRSCTDQTIKAYFELHDYGSWSMDTFFYLNADSHLRGKIQVRMGEVHKVCRQNY